MSRKNRLLVSALALGTICISSHAAERISIRDNMHELKSKSQLLIETRPAEFLGLSSDNTLVKSGRSVAPHVARYRQMYKGIPIHESSIVIAKKNGAFNFGYGDLINYIEQDLASVTPNFSNIKALEKAKEHSSVGISASSLSYQNEKSELVIFIDDNNTARLAYSIEFLVEGLGFPSRPTYVLDAIDINAQPLDFYDNMQTENATGPGGNEKSGQYEYGTDFGHNIVKKSGSTCQMINTNVKTINMKHSTNGSTVHSFNCPRNTVKQINGAYSPLNDAHYFGGVVFDMFKDWFNAAPLSFQLTMRVHYDKNYENAFWDGRAMTFGDGRNTFYPFVSLDVSAHEVSHGYTEQNSGLKYSGRSGGLNESYSDMSGEAAEYYMKGTNDWLVGKEIFKGNGALRYMNNPPRDNRSIGHASDFKSNMDVHYSSGVFNKAFYLLASKSGWNTRKAFEVMTIANRDYWTKNTNWDDAGSGSMDAACDLGYDVNDVQDALASVGVTSSASSNDCGDPGPGPGPEPGPSTELENGVFVTGLTAQKNNYLEFTLEVPASANNVKFNMKGGSGNGDLYVKFGGMPTDSDYDCRSNKNRNKETCSLSNSGGTYYIRIKAESNFSGVKLVGKYDANKPPSGPVPIDDITNDISVERKWKRYTQELGDDYSQLKVTISGGTGNVNLLVRHGTKPTTSTYDCRSKNSGNSEECTFNNPASGVWHIGLKPRKAASGVKLQIQAN